MNDDQLIAVWREAGAWWEGEAGSEIRRWRTARGGLRDEVVPLDQVGRELAVPEVVECAFAHREDVMLRPRKVRDEKVRKACGLVQEPDAVGVQRRGRSAALLHALSGYSFGHSILFASEIPRRAAMGGAEAVLLADRFSMAGVLEFGREARKCGVKGLVGVTVEMAMGGELVLVARDARGYRSLSHLVTACHLDEPRLFPLATWERLEMFSEGVMCLTAGSHGVLDLLVARGERRRAGQVLDRLVGLYGREGVWVEIERSYLPWQVRAERTLRELAGRAGVRCVAGGAMTHGEAEQFPAQDIALCAATLCVVDEPIGRKPQRGAGQGEVRPRPLRSLNAERRMRSVAELEELYAGAPDLLENTLRFAEACESDVLPGRTELPVRFEDEERALWTAIETGARLRHRMVSSGLLERLRFEYERIVRLGFARHFLMAWDVCRWSEDQGIQFSGRGSVVDSAVAYCLGLSRIDAFTHHLHFDRFLPEDGSKRPDIDLDFEARRRDDVRHHLVSLYGREHVAGVAAFGAYNTRGILREVGKAMGLDEKAIGFIAKKVHGSVDPERLAYQIQNRPELRDSGISTERLEWIFKLAGLLADVPRNARAHSSGVVVCATPLRDTVPVQMSGADGEEGFPIIQWDKRSSKYCFDKLDILCLRGQDVLSGTEERVRVRDLDFSVSQIDTDDPHSYAAMRSGELIGIPQSASPAMRQAHMRLQTENLADASLVQAGIRPGVGGAVKINELIGRRRGTRSYQFDHPDFERILGHTYGIIVFQEQVDQLLQTFCGCTSGEAEEIREEIHKRRREDYGQTLRPELIRRSMGAGYSEGVATQAVDLVAGFRGYGFAQGHALAFAEISVRSIFCQQNYPAEYFAALLDAQPAGYYGPCTLLNEARNRGVAVLPVDVRASERRFLVEDVRSAEEPELLFPGGGIRLALSLVNGLSGGTMEAITRERPFASAFDFVRRVRPERDELEALILAGALDGLHGNRRALLWAVPDLVKWRDAEEASLPVDLGEPGLVQVGDFCAEEKAVRERAVLGVDVARHLMQFERERVAGKGGVTTAEARRLPHGAKAVVVGNPLRLRFPPTPSGKRVVFFDLEDETGLLNVTCFDAVYRRDGHAIVCSPYVTLVGRAQHREDHVAFLASRVFAYRPEIVKRIDLIESLPVETSDFLVG